jgi:hypothetical protein
MAEEESHVDKFLKIDLCTHLSDIKSGLEALRKAITSTDYNPLIEGDRDWSNKRIDINLQIFGAEHAIEDLENHFGCGEIAWKIAEYTTQREHASER